jgi:hypothetical protein
MSSDITKQQAKSAPKQPTTSKDLPSPLSLAKPTPKNVQSSSNPNQAAGASTTGSSNPNQAAGSTNTMGATQTPAPTLSNSSSPAPAPSNSSSSSSPTLSSMSKSDKEKLLNTWMVGMVQQMGAAQKAAHDRVQQQIQKDLKDQANG